MSVSPVAQPAFCPVSSAVANTIRGAETTPPAPAGDNRGPTGLRREAGAVAHAAAIRKAQDPDHEPPDLDQVLARRRGRVCDGQQELSTPLQPRHRKRADRGRHCHQVRPDGLVRLARAAVDAADHGTRTLTPTW